MMVEVIKMVCLYELEIQSFPNGTACERYGIGIFRTRLEAEETAQRYLKEVKGFCDYYCEYIIKESRLIGSDTGGLVHTYFAWNTDADMNETDIICGPLYADADAAEAAMNTAKAKQPRQEWVLRHWQPGKCEWTEGFEREYPDGSTAPTMKELRDTLRACLKPRTICAVEFELKTTGTTTSQFP